jgi:lysophospholipase L1-like esterase
MWHAPLLCLLSTAQARNILPRQDTAQIARNVSGFTAYDVLNYTNTYLDDSPRIEAPLRILCVGDSITEGAGSSSNGGDGNGYRLSLAEHLSSEFWGAHQECSKESILTSV